jgi:hypothetical protein
MLSNCFRSEELKYRHSCVEAVLSQLAQASGQEDVGDAF